LILNHLDSVAYDKVFDLVEPSLSIDAGIRSGRENGLEGSGGNILVNSYTPNCLSSRRVDQLNVGSGLDVRTLSERVFTVFPNFQVGGAQFVLESVEERRDGTVSFSRDRLLFSIVLDSTLEDLLVRTFSSERVINERESSFVFFREVVGSLESLDDIVGSDFFRSSFRNRLDVLVESGLHLFGEVEGKVLLNDVGDSSLSGLRVDSDDGFVSESAIGRVERKVGDLDSTERRVSLDL